MKYAHDRIRDHIDAYRAIYTKGSLLHTACSELGASRVSFQWFETPETLQVSRAGRAWSVCGPPPHFAPSRFVRIEVSWDNDSHRGLVWLPMCTSDGVFLWGGRWGILPFVRRFVKHGPEKESLVKNGPEKESRNAKGILEAFLEAWNHRREKEQEDQDEEQTEEDEEDGQQSEQDSDSLAKSPFSFLRKWSYFLTGSSGARGGRPWLAFEDHPSRASFRIAQTQVLTAQIEVRGLVLYDNWSADHRAVDAGDPVCPVHTSQDADAGLVRYLAANLPAKQGEPLESLGLAASLIPYLRENEPRRIVIATGSLLHAQPLQHPETPRVSTPTWHALEEALSKDETHLALMPLMAGGANLLTAFTFFRGYTHENGIVVSVSAAHKLALHRQQRFHYGVPWLARPEELDQLEWKLAKNKGLRRRKWRPEILVDAAVVGHDYQSLGAVSNQKARLEGRFRMPLDGRQLPWPGRCRGVQRRNLEDPTDGAHLVGTYRAVLSLDIEEEARPAQPGDKLANLHGNKG